MLYFIMSLWNQNLNKYYPTLQKLSNLVPLFYLFLYAGLYYRFSSMNDDVLTIIFGPQVLSIVVAIIYLYVWYVSAGQAKNDKKGISKRSLVLFRGQCVLFPFIMIFPYVYLRFILGLVPYELVLFGVFILSAIFIVLDRILVAFSKSRSSRFTNFLYFSLFIAVFLLDYLTNFEVQLFHYLTFVPIVFLYGMEWVEGRGGIIR